MIDSDELAEGFVKTDVFGVEIEQALPLGYPVTARVGSASLECVVRHVHHSPNGF